MNFKLPFDMQESDLQLDAHSKIVLTGSCFADNISKKNGRIGIENTL